MKAVRPAGPEPMMTTLRTADVMTPSGDPNHGKLRPHGVRLESSLALFDVHAEFHGLASVTLEQLIAILAQRVLEFVEAEAVGRLSTLFFQADELVVNVLPLGGFVSDGRGPPRVAVGGQLPQNLAGHLADNGGLVVFVAVLVDHRKSRRRGRVG